MCGTVDREGTVECIVLSPLPSLRSFPVLALHCLLLLSHGRALVPYLPLPLPAHTKDDTHTEETTAVAPSRAARQLLEQGRCEDVVRMTTRAIHDDPTALLAFALRAKAHLALGQLEDAEKDCQAVLSERVVPGPIYTLRCRRVWNEGGGREDSVCAMVVSMRLYVYSQACTLTATLIALFL